MSAPFDAAYLRSRVTYVPETGVFTWLPHPGKANGNRAWDKQWAGRSVHMRETNPEHGAYHMIRLDGRMYMAHRLAWLWMTGEWPKAELDHINHNKVDNRFCNLREATMGQNRAYKKAMRNNLLGVKGVYKKGNRYVAQIRYAGKTKTLGYFVDITSAMLAHHKAHVTIHGEFSMTAIKEFSQAPIPSER